MDFSINPDHEAIREGVRAVVQSFGDDCWLERDERGVFPFEFHKAMVDGGSGLGVTEAMVMMYQIGGARGRNLHSRDHHWQMFPSRHRGDGGRLAEVRQ